MAPPVPGVQKPPCRVGKRFRDRLVAAPEGKVKKPAGLKTKLTEINIDSFWFSKQFFLHMYFY
jgi:hypothetical protein